MGAQLCHLVAENEILAFSIIEPIKLAKGNLKFIFEVFRVKQFAFDHTGHFWLRDCRLFVCL